MQTKYKSQREVFVTALVLLLLLLFAVEDSLISNTNSSGNDNSVKSSNSLQLSSITCSQGTVLVRNLFLIDGSLHAFLGTECANNMNATKTSCSNNGDSRNCSSDNHRISIDHSTNGWSCDDIVAGRRPLSLGIGYGSSRLLLLPHGCDNFSPPDHTIDDHTYVLWLHASNPPSYQSFEVVKEPTVFFSTLWDNFFRAVYAGVGAWHSLHSFDLLFKNHHRMLLIDPSPPHFASVLQHATPAFPLEYFSSIKHKHRLWKAAVLGISPAVTVDELVVERHHDFRFIQRNHIFTQFCQTLKKNILASSSATSSSRSNHAGRRITVIQRQTKTRQLLNFDQLVARLKQSFPNDDFQVVSFESLSLASQLHIVAQTGVLIGMHGAGMTHTLFLKPGSLVLELFPFAFRKTIYQNLAAIMSIRYAFWQNTHPSNTIGHWNVVSNPHDPAILKLPLNWSNLDAKNYWRNQDTIVDVDEVVHVLDSALSFSTRRYLMYMPWEQLNNQLLGLVSACALGVMLKRTVVVPNIGYRKAQSTRQTMFLPDEYHWVSWADVFDWKKLMNAPCRVMTDELFYGLNGKQSIGRARYHHLNDKVTSPRQVIKYYSKIGHVFDNKIAWDNAYYGLNRDEIMILHGHDRSRVLALGTLFHYYNFNATLHYPITRYTNFLTHPFVDPLYHSIRSSIRPSPRYFTIASQLLDDMKRHLHRSHLRVLTIHVRRGDYLSKCLSDFSPSSFYFHRCFPSDSFLSALIRTVKDMDAVYIMTSPSFNFTIPSDGGQVPLSTTNEQFDFSGLDVRVPFFFYSSFRNASRHRERFGSGRLVVEYDETELDNVMVDMCVGVLSDVFMGTASSSLSRSVAEWRFLKSKESMWIQDIDISVD